MNDIHTNTFAATMDALNGVINDAAERTAEAHGYMCRHERNAAIGTLVGLEDILTDAIALYRAALALHRRSVP
jgi:hypothetical protein